MSSNEAPEVLTPAQTASALGVSIDTLRRWEKAGKINARRTPGGQRRFPLTEVDRLRGTTEVTPSTAEAGVSTR